MHSSTHDPETLARGWIGRPVSRASVIAALTIPLVTSMTMMVEPMLLAALAHSGRIAVSQIGQIATGDFALTGVVTVLAVARIAYSDVRKVTLIAAIAMAVANLVSAIVPSTFAILGARMIAGCASGLFMWLLIGIITRSALPARMNGIYLALQGTVSLILAALFGTIIIPRLGADGGFLILAGCSLLAVTGCFALDREFDPPRHGKPGYDRGLPGRGWIALITILISMAAIFGLWVHFPPLAAELGYPAWAERVAVPLAIGAEIAGGAAAAVLAPRGSWLRILQLNFVAVIAVAALFCLVASPVIYVVAAAALGFLWMFTTPLQYPFAMATDPSLRTVNFVTPAQLVGSGVGPAIVSLGIQGSDVRGAMAVAAGLMVVALGMLTLLARRSVSPAS